MFKLASSHLVGLHFGDQVIEGRHAVESHHGLALLRGQTLHLGDGHAIQHNLLATQEVLELDVKGWLTAQWKITYIH